MSRPIVFLSAIPANAATQPPYASSPKLSAVAGAGRQGTPPSGATSSPPPPGRPFASDALPVLQDICNWLEDAIGTASHSRDRSALLHLTRNRALLLMLFWRRVSAAELLGVRVEELGSAAPAGICCELAGPTGRRRVDWQPLVVPGLEPLCPVSALRLWLSVSRRHCGPLFPRIGHGGVLTLDALGADAVLPLLFELSAVADSEHAAALTCGQQASGEPAPLAFPERNIAQKG